ncbi:non-homologous end-joining DNA ligase [Rhodococcus sp. RD6.2]|uniref:non-homologous end-joining DNA ligase n=1 Tax=Rhodococcus sp. RD6.2 TaxID=260936 RepID=UPI0009FF0EF5|nr:non-homologous end-joining DNA ligase [Rhodococcus sp. RD6.2]
MAHNTAVRVGNRRLTLTNLDKVLYPDSGTTKAEVLQYFTEVGPALVPLLTGRPLTRKRWPDGTAADPFFQKNVEAATPDWIPRHTLTQGSRTVVYPEVDELADLVYFAQSGALEFHVPQWRFAPDGSPGAPDRLVIDLDPGPGVTLDECAQVALRVRERLQARGLDALPVTSGSKGIHLYAGVGDGWTSRRCSEVAKEIAVELERQTPEQVTSTMSKAVRAGKVFVDWSQNSATKTTISPYSLRGTAQPTVAAPRTWAELTAPDLRQLDFHEVVERLRGGVAPATVPRPHEARQAIAGAGVVGGRNRVEAPMLATAATASEFASRADPDTWALEYKYDGIRALVSFGGEDHPVRLTSRNGLDIGVGYPELLHLPAGLTGHSGVLDGEIVAFGDDGAPSFGRLQQRMGRSRPPSARERESNPVALLLFDVLELDGVSVRDKPLRDRRRVLEAIRIPEGDSWRVPDLAPPDLDEALDSSRAAHMEGLVAKRWDSGYRSGRSSVWLKLKHFRTCEVVIGGWLPGEGGRAKGVGSVLVGLPAGPGRLRYLGRVGSGMSDATLGRLRDLVAETASGDSPFGDTVPAVDARSARWVRPETVAEVRYSELTDDGRLRHPVWRGLRPDKSAADVEGVEGGGC